MKRTLRSRRRRSRRRVSAVILAAAAASLCALGLASIASALVGPPLRLVRPARTACMQQGPPPGLPLLQGLGWPTQGSDCAGEAHQGTFSEFQSLSHKALQDRCRLANLSCVGKRSELIARLEDTAPGSSASNRQSPHGAEAGLQSEGSTRAASDTGFGTQDGPITREDDLGEVDLMSLRSLRKEALQAWCRDAGLPVEGTKSELIGMLQELKGEPSSLRKAALQARCRAAGLPDDGTRAELIARVEEFEQRGSSAPTSQRDVAEAADLPNGGTASTDPAEEGLASFSKAALVSRCKAMGLKVIGSKADLIARLEDPDKEGLDAWSFATLVARCTAAGLSGDGRKAELIARLENPSKQELSSLSRAMLQTRCRAAGLYDNGTTAELIARLEDPEKDGLSSLSTLTLEFRCKAMGLPISGTRAELIACLEASHVSSAGGQAESPGHAGDAGVQAAANPAGDSQRAVTSEGAEEGKDASPTMDLVQDRRRSVLDARADALFKETERLAEALHEQEGATRACRAELAACRAELAACQARLGSTEAHAEEAWRRLFDAERSLAEAVRDNQRLEDKAACAEGPPA